MELILSIVALTKGLYTVVASSLIGSILSNLLLVLGEPHFCPAFCLAFHVHLSVRRASITDFCRLQQPSKLRAAHDAVAYLFVHHAALACHPCHSAGLAAIPWV